VLRVGAERLAELGVVEDAPDAGDVGQHAVEDLALRLILIEALADVVAQIAPALRDADAEGTPDRTTGRVRGTRVVARRIAQERDDVARRGIADAEHLWIFRRVGQLVERAGLGLRPFRQQLDHARIGIGPAGCGNLRRRVRLLATDGEFRLRL